MFFPFQGVSFVILCVIMVNCFILRNNVFDQGLFCVKGLNEPSVYIKFHSNIRVYTATVEFPNRFSLIYVCTSAAYAFQKTQKHQNRQETDL